nr:RNA-directed DNA polymerase, eukaryota [Tanacetum cinerariifolium]
MDIGVVDDSTVLCRLELKNNLLKLTKMEAKDRIQKSKVNWAVEGDENSKFFHGIINKRRSQLAIRGVFVDGIWRSDPVRIKNAFSDHFEARFKKPADQKFKLNFQFHKILLKDQADDLKRGVSRDKIRIAVWNCGDNKSPGPDGFNFEFFKKYWNVVGSDFCEAIEHFFTSGGFSKGCNSSFVTLIPKIIDAKYSTAEIDIYISPFYADDAMFIGEGINVDSCVCPICSTEDDEIDHILFRCDLAQQ